MLKELESSDWEEAFKCSRIEYLSEECKNVLNDSFRPEDVKEILEKREGENDGEHWLLFAKLNDERYIFLSAWCDYTGWDCQSGGTIIVGKNIKDMMKKALTKEARQVFGIEHNTIGEIRLKNDTEKPDFTTIYSKAIIRNIAERDSDYSKLPLQDQEAITKIDNLLKCLSEGGREYWKKYSA